MRYNSPVRPTDPAVQLLITHALPEPGERLLIFGAAQELLLAVLAIQTGEGATWVHDIHSGHLQGVRLLIESAAPPHQVECLEAPHLPPELAASLDRIYLILPKGRVLARRWLRMAWDALRPSGRLYLVGPKKGGVQAVFTDAADLFGASALLGYKKGFHLARFTRPAHTTNPPEWFAAPGIAPGTWQVMRIEYPDLPSALVTLPGVFSAPGLDDGTRHLLDVMKITPGERILDLGCGCGVIGLLAARRGAAQVDLVDINLYAIAACRENMLRFDATLARAAPGHASEPFSNERYSLVVTNPPFHAGRQVDTAAAQDFIASAARVLLPGGRFLLVANRFLPYEKGIARYFAHQEQLFADGRFKVICAQQ